MLTNVNAYILCSDKISAGDSTTRAVIKYYFLDF